MTTSAKIRSFAPEWNRVIYCSRSGVTPNLQEADGELAIDALAGHFKGRRVVLANTTGLIAQFAERYLLVYLLPLRK